MTTFDPNDDRLTAYVLGELDDAGRVDVEQLLAASPQLQTELAEIANLAGILRADLASEPAPSLTTTQRQELMQSPVPSSPVHPAATAAPATRRLRRIKRWALVVAGSVICLEIGFGFHLRSSQLRPESEPTFTKQTKVTPYYSELPEDRVADLSDSMAVANVKLGVRFTAPEDAASISTTNGVTLRGNSGFGLGMPHTGGNQQGGQGGFGGGQGGVFVGGFRAQGGGGDASLPAVSMQVASPQTGSSASSSHAPARPGGLVTFADDNGNVTLHLGTVESKPDQSKPSQVPPGQEQNAPVQLHKYFLPAKNGKPVAGESRLASTAESETSSKLNYSQPEGQGQETYEAPVENPFLTPAQQPLSTFSIDVDSASYSNVRRFLAQGQLPPPDAVRIEEMINYFHYDYPQPKNGEPFSVTADAAPCPWRREHYLARIGLQARTIDKTSRPPTNLVFLLDVSGSMQPANKLPLVKQAMSLLAEELNERDRIAIVTYAGDAGIKLTSTPGSDQVRIMQAIECLQAGGSTNGAAGINLAYEEALKNFNGEGENRVILCTDGDFNVGVSSDDQLVQLIQQQAKSKVFLSIFGFGMGNLKDAKLEKLADKGNGHYGYIDDLKEARRVFSEELVGTLYTVAKDVKIQVEFNPLTVGAYRLIGYENRTLAARDFNDDTKDAGEIGAGHTVTALYEIVPRSQLQKAQAVDPLKYGDAGKNLAAPADVPRPNIPADAADDLFTVKLRYKEPAADTSVKTIDYVVDDINGKNVAPSADQLWAAAVASFGMQLRQSQFKGQWTLQDVYETASGVKGNDPGGRRREFLDLVQAAQRLKKTP